VGAAFVFDERRAMSCGSATHCKKPPQSDNATYGTASLHAGYVGEGVQLGLWLLVLEYMGGTAPPSFPFRRTLSASGWPGRGPPLSPMGRRLRFPSRSQQDATYRIASIPPSFGSDVFGPNTIEKKVLRPFVLKCCLAAPPCSGIMFPRRPGPPPSPSGRFADFPPG